MSVMSYNGGTVLAMAGNECVCIASDLRIGEQMTTWSSMCLRVPVDKDVFQMYRRPEGFCRRGHWTRVPSWSFWRENMGPDGLFEATAQSTLSCLERDAASGWGAVVYTITKDKLDKVNISTIKARMD